MCFKSHIRNKLFNLFHSVNNSLQSSNLVKKSDDKNKVDYLQRF
jgi:hypothetical protein